MRTPPDPLFSVREVGLSEAAGGAELVEYVLNGAKALPGIKFTVTVL